jgi:ribonuclease HI
VAKASKNGKNEFMLWLKDEEAKGTTMVYTDGSFIREKHRGSYGVCISEQQRWIHDHSDWCAAASSYDSKLAALESAIQWISTHRRHATCICIASDNKSVITSFLDMSAHSSQTSSLCINLALLDLFSANPNISIHLTHCPSHSSIPGNERADKLATIGGGLLPPPTSTLRANFLNNYVQNMDLWWKSQASMQEYRGWQWLIIKHKRKRFMPSIQNKTNANFFVLAAKDSISAMARITRCITNHAPTGEYRQRFFPGKPSHCVTCGNKTLLSRKHILFSCPCFSLIAPTIHDWQRSNNNDKSLFNFLSRHPESLSFESLLPDVP